MITHDKVFHLFNDKRYEEGLIIFLDARDKQHYTKGHIPGAHDFDYYQLKDYVGVIIPLCFSAEKIVVYCNGGHCEDSKLAASFLHSAGIAQEKLFVYAGGWSEWSSNNLPIEVGERNSFGHPGR